MRSGFTLRAFMAGVCLSFFISIFAPYGVLMIKGSEMAENFATPAAMFILLILTLVINPLLKLVRKSWGFSHEELAAIYVMMIVACSIPTMGLTANLLPTLSGAFYYASSENEWEDIIWPYLPGWLFPKNPEVTVKYFYEGLSKGESIPWGAWTRSLLAWLPLLLAIYLMMISMMVVLRRQWVERERLLFPLVQLPLEMMEQDVSLLGPFFRNKLMWLGFSIPFLIGLWNGLHSYYHFLPPIKTAWSFPILRRTTGLNIKVIFPIIGFAYLVNLNVAFSLWSFSILGNVQTGIMRMIGWSIGPREPYCASSPSVSYQAMGAMIVLVVYGLWIARGHLRDVLRRALWRGSGLDDSGEMMSYRTAIFSIVLGSTVVVLWLEMAGLRWYFTLIFLSAAFCLFLGLTRIVCEGGVAFAKAPLIPQYFLTYAVGSNALGPVGLAGLATTFAWSADIKTFVMSSVANGLKVADTARMRKRPLFWGVLVAILISIAGSVWITLKLGYKYGGINLHPWYFGGCPRVPYEDFMGHILLNPASVDPRRWAFAGIGAGIMGFLMFMNHRFFWWPIHPLGFPIGNTLPLIKTWFSIFLAWLFKTTILKYGGAGLYRKFRPFFLGLVVGHIAVAGMWLIIDYFTGMTNNFVPFQ
ncbi:MAG TPA: hypothetical protein EYP17_09380 [Candidatus Latescibacteria bacterium]|nr:hypothetical protein [Candidatus Latescibacterota bacterium]